MDDARDLPESESTLYELATCSDEDPYTRESAIKKLGTLDTVASERQLAALTEDGLSVIKRQLAQKWLCRRYTASAYTGSVSVPEIVSFRAGTTTA